MRRSTAPGVSTEADVAAALPPQPVSATAPSRRRARAGLDRLLLRWVLERVAIVADSARGRRARPVDVRSSPWQFVPAMELPLHRANLLGAMPVTRRRGSLPRAAEVTGRLPRLGRRPESEAVLHEWRSNRSTPRPVREGDRRRWACGSRWSSKTRSGKAGGGAGRRARSPAVSPPACPRERRRWTRTISVVGVAGDRAQPRPSMATAPWMPTSPRPTVRSPGSGSSSRSSSSSAAQLIGRSAHLPAQLTARSGRSAGSRPGPARLHPRTIRWPRRRRRPGRRPG